MKIILDTEKKRIKETKPTKIDRNLMAHELEVRVANLLAIAIAVQAKKNYTHENVRLQYIDEIAKSAKNMLKQMEEQE